MPSHASPRHALTTILDYYQIISRESFFPSSSHHRYCYRLLSAHLKAPFKSLFLSEHLNAAVCTFSYGYFAYSMKAIDIHQQQNQTEKIMENFIIPFRKLNTNMIRIFSWFTNIILLLYWDLITNSTQKKTERKLMTKVWAKKWKIRWFSSMGNFLINFISSSTPPNSRNSPLFSSLQNSSKTFDSVL